MVQDSFVNKFSAGAVSVAGVDIAGRSATTDSIIRHFIDSARITYPICKGDTAIRNSYSVGWDGIVVIDKNGIVQFRQGQTGPPYEGMVSGAASKVRSLLASGIMSPKAFTAFTGYSGNSLPRYYTLSGQTIPYPITSARTGIVLRSIKGQVTGIIHLIKR
jgi:hypothetical protein